MEDNGKQKNGIDNIRETAEGIKEAKNVAAEGAKLVASAASGNVVEAAKSAAKLAKSSLTKKNLKRCLIMMGIGVMITILLVSIVFCVFNAIKDKMIELASSIKNVAVGFWKWLTDDYWIKLDKEIDYEEVDVETRTGRHA